MPYKDRTKKRESDQKWYRERGSKMRAEQRRKNRDMFNEFRKTLYCSRCGFSDWRCLEFHHRDPSTKKFEIPRAAVRGHKSQEEMEQEIAKCDVLCANCHRIQHYEKTYSLSANEDEGVQFSSS